MLTNFLKVINKPRKSAAPPSAVGSAGATRGLVEQADLEREKRNYVSAALLYERALILDPRMAAIHIQCAHMFKEAGDLAAAERHYLEAQRLTPDDPDLTLQLGHFYKVADRLDDALASYRNAADLRPDWTEPLRELAELQRHAEGPIFDSAWTGSATRLAPELLPGSKDRSPTPHPDAVYIKRLGARGERSGWGFIHTLRGVEAIRGFCLSSIPIGEVVLCLGDAVVGRGPVQASAAANGGDAQGKYVFNLWLDFSPFPPGLHRVTLRFMAAGWEVRRHAEHVLLEPARAEAAFPDSDSVVELSPGDGRPADAQIRSRPSIVRSARRSLIPGPIANVLVLRTDQLGDLVISIPALRRLRELLPRARLVGLLTAANAGLAETLGLFDEIIVIEFPDDPLERRRIMPLDIQERLRERLEPYRFDIAIDLAESAVSRPLLLLSGAGFLYGFHDRDWPWLTAGFEGATHDASNGLEVAAQSTKVMALVERLGASLTSKAETIRRPDLGREALAPFGIVAEDRYAVLHTGARIAFSRWPHYEQLAALVLDRTDLKVIMVTDDTGRRAALPAGLSRSGRFHLLDARLPFDTLDAILSFCAVFVGNDSGPKHLAALRGAPVVSLHSARINWSEWGQELTGSIISRRVPCAGCAIFHEADECGKQFACIIDISAEEVFAEMARLLDHQR